MLFVLQIGNVGRAKKIMLKRFIVKVMDRSDLILDHWSGGLWEEAVTV